MSQSSRRGPTFQGCLLSSQGTTFTWRNLQIESGGSWIVGDALGELRGEDGRIGKGYLNQEPNGVWVDLVCCFFWLGVGWERYVIYVLFFWPEIFQNAVGLFCFGPGAGSVYQDKEKVWKGHELP